MDKLKKTFNKYSLFLVALLQEVCRLFAVKVCKYCTEHNLYLRGS